MGKTKVMRCQFSSGQVEKLREYPCGVSSCRQGVGRNFIRCTVQAVLSGYIRCCGAVGRLQDLDASIYRCPLCVGAGIVSVNGVYILN